MPLVRRAWQTVSTSEVSSQKFHQSLTPEEAREALKKIIHTAEAYARISKNKDEFLRLVKEKYHPKRDLPYIDVEAMNDDKKETKFDKAIKVLLKTPPQSKEKTKLLTDNQLQNKFNYYQQKIHASQKKNREKALDKYLVPVFATVREVIQRQTELLLFPTQIFGGIVLHHANIAQMNTGEGKTLTAFLPICLNALSGRTVFVITVNEYLAQRDWHLAKPILDFCQITSGVNLTNLKNSSLFLEILAYASAV
ncbi:2781_t:CDS:2 [Ambispora gerdemannii]|uniref:2781_t:CDS:1 n=1 Tax=Ambispora gerdemannii TaxID=144530 RepID=A0A9N9D5F7_9GLOM|nr:2781_t:CDS:2 [Ambispora gerdemannii]